MHLPLNNEPQRSMNRAEPGRHRLRRWAGLTLLVLTWLASSCALVSRDPDVREPGRIVRDGFLDGRVLRAVRASNDRLAAAHLRVSVHDGVVLLLGQVANEGDRDSAANAATAVDGVRRVHNELQLGGATSMVARANDRWLATKVRSTLLRSGETRVPALRVVAENGTVFLLGRVTADRVAPAVAATRRVFGVERVVTLFDYQPDERPADSSKSAALAGVASD